MLSRSLKVLRFAPPRSLITRRTATTEAASSQVDKISDPAEDDSRFTVNLSPESFEGYCIDPPSTEMSVTKRELKKMYLDMATIRRMETTAEKLYRDKKIRGFCHLSNGQEAVAAGIEHAITPEDQVITSYRCHGFALMRGASVKSIIAELLGRREGIAYGKGGSMHMFTKGFYGGNGIVGAQVPVGAGIGFAMKYMSRPNTTFALYGDGASNQGQVFEAYNMAKLWGIPVIFACENNKYGMGTSAERSSALTDYYKRGQYIPGIKVNGMDVLAVKHASAYAKDYTISRNSPMVIEFETYRFVGHSPSDPAIYRKRDEVQRMRRKDPIVRFGKKIMEWGLVSEGELKALDKEATELVNEQVREALEAPVPEPSPKTLYEDIYVPGSEPDFLKGRTLEETHYFRA